MEEPLSVEWSASAVAQLDKFYQYLLDKWSLAEAEKFLDLVFEFESVISHHPDAFIRSSKMKKI